MRVQYVGGHLEVEVAATGHVAKRNGDPIDVPDEVGQSLIEQDTWSEVKDSPKPAVKTPKKDD